jgi:hypothetical protein
MSLLTAATPSSLRAFTISLRGKEEFRIEERSSIFDFSLEARIGDNADEEYIEGSLGNNQASC